MQLLGLTNSMVFQTYLIIYKTQLFLLYFFLYLFLSPDILLPSHCMCGGFFYTWSHSMTNHTRYDSSGRVTDPSQRLLPDTQHQHSQKIDIHGAGRIRTRNHRKRAAADPRLRLRGYRDWLQRLPTTYIYVRLCTTLNAISLGILAFS
jgi:hypothetical protein